MEVSLLVLLVLLERNRPDLRLRRAWARLPLPRHGSGIRVPTPVALAGVDLRRWTVRVSIVPLAYVLWRVFAPALPAQPYDGVNLLVGFYLAFLGLMIVALVAATAGRDRGEELLAALPAGPRSRVLGWVVLLLVLALLEYALLAGLRFARPEPAYAGLLPDAWELAQGPLLLLGGGVFGLLLARCVPAWVAVPLAVVLTVVWTGTFAEDDGGLSLLAPMYEWIQYREDDLVIVEPGSFAWHNAFLLGLCALGVVAALVREAGRRRGLLVAGLGALTGTGAAAWLALP